MNKLICGLSLFAAGACFISGISSAVHGDFVLGSIVLVLAVANLMQGVYRLSELVE